MGSIEMGCAGWILLAGFLFLLHITLLFRWACIFSIPFLISFFGSYGFVCVGTDYGVVDLI